MRYLLFLLLLNGATLVQASDLIYRPTNPAFGGNALNGSYLLNNAQAQNDTKGPAYKQRNDLDRFTSTLQMRLLSQLLEDVESGSTGAIQTDDFSVSVVDDGSGGLMVEVTDLNTNETTVISVNGLITE